jgi:hypothetical protein
LNLIGSQLTTWPLVSGVTFEFLNTVDFAHVLPINSPAAFSARSSFGIPCPMDRFHCRPGIVRNDTQQCGRLGLGGIGSFPVLKHLYTPGQMCKLRM